MRHGQLAEDNQQLLTLVHGVDRKGRPVIRAYTGNSQHPAYHEYQDVIDEQYQKAARLASSRSSRTTNSLYRLNVNDSYFDCCSRSATSAATTHISTRWSPSLPGSSRGVSTPIIPDLRGMRAVISRLRCSLAIHAGLAGTSNELTFLPVIPVRFRKQPNCPKKECTNEKPPPTKPDLKGKSRKDCCSTVSVPQSMAASLSYNTDCCQGSKGQTCSKSKKRNRRAKTTNKRVKKRDELR